MAIEFSHILTLLYFVVPLLLTGVISGFLAGLLGVGGGIVIVPILAYLLEVSGIHTTTPMHVAVGTSLAIIVPTSIISARSHFRLGNVDFQLIKQLGPSVFIGAFGGAILASYLDNNALKIIFGSLAVLIGISFMVQVIVLRHGLPSILPRTFIGSAIGLISSLVGIGGGSLTVPTLATCGWDMRRAVGTSSLMGLVIAIPGMVSFMIVGFASNVDISYGIGFVWLPGALIISFAAYFVTPFGAMYSSKINQSQLRRIFAIFLIIVGARLAISGYLSGGMLVFGG